MYSVLDVSRHVINYCNDKDYDLSNLKLQKLLYFIQAYYVSKTASKEPCFGDKIEAWVFGPVVPRAYHEYKKYGSTNIPPITTYIQIDENDFWQSKVVKYNDETLAKSDKELIDRLIDNFSKFSTTALVRITHNQLPWIEAYNRGKDKVITVEAMRSYFNGR